MATNTTKKTPAKTTKKKAAPKKTTKTKAKPLAGQSVADVSKQANKKRSSSKGVIAIIVGILIVAVVGAATLGERNQQFAPLTTFLGDSYSLQYPQDWTSQEDSDTTEFYSGESADESAAGFVVLDTGRIPGYQALEQTQKDELINLALETIETDDQSIRSGFSEVSTSTVELSEHPAADKAISFELQGTLREGGEGTLLGFMLIAESGQTYVISAGGNTDVYTVNSATIAEMLQSFRVEEGAS